MEDLYARCAGLDVHKDSVVAYVRISADGTLTRQVRTFATTTSGLLLLLNWLEEHGCTHVAMAATGVYWRPVWHVLSDGTFDLVLANAAHVKNVPGRKFARSLDLPRSRRGPTAMRRQTCSGNGGAVP